ncbi:glycosyltransferase family 2 protein [Maribacter algarum]|uniref:Glycosyltransferase family 2 protein n=1 Tax=Maribacter algarum (ex Zhang et al. 2020) TaxID=2578118 RepID=A0A5S3PGM4_9FLAO|nr:glycosyltransferase family 2 protein [Maribacter algarum]TMM53273.1 glycosyltransferase family 2 protein [Maribacter algarum]
MSKNKSDVAIILINYNSSEYTQKCISSILDQTSALAYQIIVVDNASEKEDFERLSSFVATLPEDIIQLHRSKINTGFGGGNMHGIQFTNAQYYLFLNNDTLLVDNPIKVCYEFMETHSDAALCGPQIYNERNEKTVSFDHFTSFAREVFGRKTPEILFAKPNRKKDYSEPIAVDYVNGSFMFFRAEDFDKIGGFDTNIFLYFEECDICYRLKKQGRKTYFLPNPSYIHHQGISVNKTKMPIAIKIELKTSMFYVIRKNYGYLHYLALRLVFIIRYGLTSLIKPKYFKLFHRILVGLPLGKSLKQKQTIQD